VDLRNVDGAVAVRSVGVPSVDGWAGPRRAADPWYAAAPGRREFRAVYAHGAGEVEVGVWLYDRQSAGEELVGALDSALGSGRAQLVDNRPAAALATGFAPREIVLREGSADRVIWYWYSIGGTRTASDAYAKLLEAWNTLARGGADSTLIVLTAEASESAVARAALADFAGAAADRIDGCLRSGARCADVR
jgi:EpsI family protein